MVAETNTAYSNSGVNQRIKLVAVEEVVGYTENKDLQIDLGRLRSPSDGHMDEVHDIRDAVAADIVLLIPAGSSGAAYQMFVPSMSFESRAFGVVNADSTRTFAHELGHIMGLHHDRYAVCGDNCNHFTLFPYAFGYVNQEALEPSPPDTAFWRTIMAYPNQCGRCSAILRFSNPDQIYPDPGGDPLGKAGLEPAPGADGPSDAVRMLNRTRGYVANFRSAPGITVSFDAETYTATEGGTTATVTVSLSDEPGRAIDIPFTATGANGAAASDYTIPRSVSFAANDTEQTFTVTAVDDAVDDDGETVTLTLDYLLPGGVSAGSPATATVTLTDNDPDPGAPSILSVWLSSDPGGGYAEGEEIEASVRFDKTVTVTGTPQLGLTVGSVTRQASYQGAAREVVTFSYEVDDDETDANGVSIAANALSLNGGTIRDSANRAAGLTHSALADDANHRVDGVAPVLQTAVVDETILTLTYDEPLAQPAPRASAFFTVAVIHPGGGRYAPEVVVDGSVMTVTLWDPVLAGEVVTVKFSNISVFGTPHLIRDLAGNPAASLRRHAVTNVTKERPYDTDGDGLIEITTLAQLDAVRHDRNGDGVPTGGGASTYRAAFPDAFVEVGSQLRCVLECHGYELMADLDFDTDDDGDVDSDDAYWNNGAGWDPIGRSGADFLTTFEGNGHTVRNLFITRPSTNHAGLFGYTDWAAKIRHVGLIQADVAGRTHVGGLVGNNLGTITACYATGQVSGLANIGGLVGSNYSSVRTSYAAAQVSGRSAAGGLVGRNLGIIIDASYATGEVSGRSSVGGLVGYEDGNTIRASYATGRVSGSSNVGGLVGGLGSSTITASYWDTTTSGQTTGDHGTGQTTAQLQAPTDDTGIYADWDADQWDFGGTDEYPVLVVDFDGDGDATWEEFGYQLREESDLTATFEPTEVTLTWTEVDTDHWDPAPDVAYTLYRDDGTEVTTLVENSSGRSYTDTGAVVGQSYTYQVAAVVDGGEATRSAQLSVTVPDSTPPTVSMIAISSDPGTDAAYAADDEIQVKVTFSETVEVTGTPQLTLELGGGRRTAIYGGGSGTAALLFAYEVSDGESDTDGVGVEADSLAGGTIQDGSNNNAVLDHDGLAADLGHKVDGVKPQLVATGGAVVDGTTLTLTYDEPLDGSSTPVPGDFTVSGGDRVRTVTGVRVNGSALELTLDVGAEHGEAGIQVSYTPGDNPIRDVPGNDAGTLSREPVANDTPDTTSPTVESLAITSNPGSDQTYAAGDEIEVTVTFDETVEVEGTPQLRLRVGTRTRTVGYETSTGTAALVFAYEVADGDDDTDGVSIEAGRIAFNGGTIKDEADNDAVLDHEAVAPQAGHTVDGVRPAFLSAAVDGPSLTLAYGEALDEGSRPAPGDFTVEVDGSGRSVSGVSVSGRVATLTLNPAVEHGDTGIRVSYAPDTNPIRDAVGNNALALSNRSVTNTTGAPNTAPEITSPSSFNVPENLVLVRRLAARDTDPGDEVAGWAIVGGADQGQFAITSDTGDLSFRTAPDFEAPGDNEYEVTVEVMSGAGARELEAEQTFTLRVTDEREPPGIPEAPTFSGETVESMTVNWSEPDNTGPAITDYDVQYRQKRTGRFTDGQHEGPGLFLTLDDLEPGTVYEVQVRATNDEGTSDWSESGEGMTVTPLTVQMTSDIEPPVEGPFTVRFSFSEPVTGFSPNDVETGQDSACMDDQNTPVFCDPLIGPLETIDDRIFTAAVTPGTDRVAHNYTLTLTVPTGRVSSLTGNKPNEEAMLAVRVAPPEVTLPISAIGLSASAGDSEVTLRWNRPTENGGSPIIRYEYRHAAVGEEWGDWENAAAGARRITVENLINDQEYVFEARAVNALGKGPAETAMEIPVRSTGPTTPPGPGPGPGPGPQPPPRPTVNTDPVITTPGPFEVTENQTRVVRIEAIDSDPGDAIRSYAIAGGADGDRFSIVAHTGVLSFREPPNFEAPADVGSTDPPSAAGDNEYIVVVRVASGPLSRDRTVEQAFAVRVTDADRESPGAPRVTRVTLPLDASLTVEWAEPENPGPPITGYDVQYREGTGGFFINAPHEGPGRTATLTGLEAATLYQVRVRARNEEGTGRWSEPGEGWTLAGPPAVLPFSLPGRGGISLTSRGTSPELRVGYGQVETDPGMDPPVGLAIFGSRLNGILVSEAGVPASAPVLEGRIVAETDGPIQTGLAMANPNDRTATVAFFFTDSDGVDFGHDTFTLEPREQKARFLDEAPFNGGATIEGTFTFTADLPVAVIALRGYVNERSEFLMTTLPVAPLTVPTTGTVYFPHFAAGGGWTTQVILVNPTHAPIRGNVQFLGPGSETQAAAPATLTLADGRSGSTFSYSVPPRSATRLRTSSTARSLQVGSVRAVPDTGQTAPAGVSIFTFRKDGMTVSEAGVPASTAGRAFRLYVEASGTPEQPHSVRSGIALTNTSGVPTTVSLELTDLDGTATGSTESLTIPASGHVARFIDEFFPNLPTPFSGILRIASTAPDIAAVGLRLAINPRNDILVTTTPPVDENATPIASDLFFPHFVDSGGWTTQFILFSGSTGQRASGVIRFTGQDGQPLELSVAPTTAPTIP